MKHKSRAEKDRRYAASVKGKARRRRYDRSAKGKARTRRWRKSSKGRSALHRYNVSAKGQAKRERSLGRATQPSGRTRAAASSEAKPQPATTPTKPERNARHLAAADFTGPCRGDTGGSRSVPGSANELLERYHRLRNR